MPKKTIKYDGDPKRLDAFLTESEHDFSREFIKKLIKLGKISVNGKTKKPAYLLNYEDEITIDMPELNEKTDVIKDIILYEDEDIMTLSKPCGIKMHPNDANWQENPSAALVGDETIVSMILKSRPEIIDSGASRMGLVHRLDRDTSGILIVAKNIEAQMSLTEQFKERLVNKTYLGVTSLIEDEKTAKGAAKYASGRIEAPIGRLAGDKKNKVWKYGRYALTEFKVIENGKNYSLLKIYPKTGRTNQIRIHLSYIGHGIAGDNLYIGPPASRLMLHSSDISFKHPTKKKKVTFKCEPPADFKNEWKRLKKI